MAQHFLLSAKARTLSLKSIYAAGEDKAYDTFRKLRWPSTDGEPVCPRCGSVDRLAVIHADEASHWDALHAGWKTLRINHSEAYSDEGCTNQAESFFSRLRKMIEGQHHHVSARHLHAYASHAAGLEDHRRLDNGSLAFRAVGLALNHSKSRDWCGYWQRERKHAA